MHGSVFTSIQSGRWLILEFFFFSRRVCPGAYFLFPNEFITCIDLQVLRIS